MLVAALLLASSMWTGIGPAQAPEAPATASSAASTIDSLINDAVDILNDADGPALLPVEELVGVAGRMTRYLLETKPMRSTHVDLLNSLVAECYMIAFRRTNDPDYLCRASEAVREGLTPHAGDPLLRGRTSVLVAKLESRYYKRMGKACEVADTPLPSGELPPSPPGGPDAKGQAEPLEKPAPADSPNPPKKPRNKLRLGGGIGLLVVSAGAIGGLVASALAQQRSNQQIVDLEASILREGRAATPEELTQAAALNDTHRRAMAGAVIAGTASVAALAGGLLLIFLPESQTRTLATPWGGLGTAGVQIRGHF